MVPVTTNQWSAFFPQQLWMRWNEQTGAEASEASGEIDCFELFWVAAVSRGLEAEPIIGTPSESDRSGIQLL